MKTFHPCLVWVRFGWNGARQLAHVDHVIKATGDLAVHKWRDRSRRWTGYLLESPVDVISDVVDLVDPVVQRAIRGAENGRPPCHHHHHFLPQVKRAASNAPLAGVGGAV
jgi:hypothetical protein